MIRRSSVEIWTVALSALFVLLASCVVRPVGEVMTPTPPGGQAPGSGPAATPATMTPAIPTMTMPASPDLPATASASPAEEATPAEYVVVAGDTLSGLAARWGVPMAAIQKLNDMGDSTVVMVGLTLLVPTSEGWEGASPYWVLHVVREGETLSQIAQRYGLGIQEILEASQLADADHIVVGQELVLPLEGPANVAPLPTVTPVRRTPTPKPASAPNALAEPDDQAAVLTLTVELAAASVVTPAPTVALVAAAPPADIADWPRETVRIINEVRAQAGLPPYTYNDTLALAAQLHAQDCAQRGSCSHTGSDGADIKTRVRRAGYTGAGWAECWAQRQTPQGAVDIWLDEEPPNDPHRQMMYHTWFTEIGVGIVQTTWGYYFIADFGRP